MKVILHIGTEKTGTSSIQEFLLQNKGALVGSGFYYLHMSGRNEYRDFSAYCMDKSRVDSYFRRTQITNEKAREVFDSNFLSSFRLKIDSIPESIHTVVISSEHFSSRLQSVEEVCRAKELLEQYFSSAQIVCYLRDQSAKICSSYSTRIKSGGTVTFDKFFNGYIDRNKNSRDEYDHRLAVWEEAFALENMNVRIFDRSAFTGGTLLRDFCSVLDESLFDTLMLPNLQQNEALSRRGCDLLRHLNYFFPERIRGNLSVEDTRVSIIGMIAKYVRGGPVNLTNEQIQLVDQRFGSSNQRICERYFPDRESLFGAKD